MHINTEDVARRSPGMETWELLLLYNGLDLPACEHYVVVFSVSRSAKYFSLTVTYLGDAQLFQDLQLVLINIALFSV